jgi:hypothetical protein
MRTTMDRATPIIKVLLISTAAMFMVPTAQAAAGHANEGPLEKLRFRRKRNSHRQRGPTTASADSLAPIGLCCSQLTRSGEIGR